MGGLYPSTRLAVGVLGEFNPKLPFVQYCCTKQLGRNLTERVLLAAFVYFFQRKKKIRKRSSPEITKVTVQIFALSLFSSFPPFLSFRHFALADAGLWVHFFSAQGDIKFYETFASSP